MRDRGTLAVSIALLGALAVGSYWLAEQARKADPLTRAVGHDIDYTADAITLTRMDETGRAQYTIDADTVVHYADDDSAELKSPRVVGSRIDRPEMRLRADRGTTTSDAEEVRLYGDVVLHRAPWRGRAEMVAKAPYMLVVPDREIARTDQPIDVVQGGSHVAASGMSYDNGDRKLELDGGRSGGRVRAVIEPRAAREARANKPAEAS